MAPGVGVALVLLAGLTGLVAVGKVGWVAPGAGTFVLVVGVCVILENSTVCLKVDDLVCFR